MKKGDIVIILIVLIIGISNIVFINVSNSQTDKKYVVIRVDKEVVQKISIDSGTNKIYEFKFGDEIGYVEVRDGKVRMQKMDKRICPQQICSLTGWIEKKHETIVCLPNKISINIEAMGDEDEKIDGVSF
ncbi:MAG: hypothetical protein PWQ37_2263 [Candidatus Petromonas sp.]|jgi:hypothetical protein|nr:hypothetical protein [Candidatus Petromonas sp.]